MEPFVQFNNAIVAGCSFFNARDEFMEITIQDRFESFQGRRSKGRINDSSKKSVTSFISTR